VLLGLGRQMHRLENSNSLKFEDVTSSRKVYAEDKNIKYDSPAVSINMLGLYRHFLLNLDLAIEYIEDRIELFSKMLSVLKMDAETRYNMIKDEERIVEAHILGNELPSLGYTKARFDAFVHSFNLEAGANTGMRCISGYSPYGKVHLFRHESIDNYRYTMDSVEMIEKYRNDPAVAQFIKLIDAGRPVSISMHYSEDERLGDMLRYAEINYGSRHIVYGRIVPSGKDAHEVEDDVRRYLFSHFYYKITELIGKGARVGVKVYNDTGIVEVAIRQVPIPEAAGVKMLVTELLHKYNDSHNGA
jgi:hypothetical protein